MMRVCHIKLQITAHNELIPHLNGFQHDEFNYEFTTNSTKKQVSYSQRADWMKSSNQRKGRLK